MRKPRFSLDWQVRTATFVDAEGSLVPVQEYLRYRVNACGHAVSEAKVFDQIDGRGHRARLRASAMPAERTLTGYGHGTSKFWNDRFQMDLARAGLLHPQFGVAWRWTARVLARPPGRTQGVAAGASPDGRPVFQPCPGVSPVIR